MSFLGGIVHGIGSAVKGVGHLAEKAAPYVGMIPGVGTIAGGAIGGLGGLAAGDGLSGAVKYGLEGAAGGYGGAALRSLSTGGKIAAAAGTLASGHPAHAPYEPGDYDPTGGSSPSAMPDGGGTNKWLMGLAGLEGLNSAYLGNKASNLSDDALKSVKGSYSERAPLRSAALSGLLHPKARDTSNLTAIRSAVPYAQLPAPKAPLQLAAGG